MKNFIYAILMSMPLFAEEELGNIQSRDDIWQTIIMLVIASFFFYFMLWRPERKRRKELDQQKEGMKKGDRVVAMGIVGKLYKIENETVILSMHDGSKIEFLKQAISEVVKS